MYLPFQINLICNTSLANCGRKLKNLAKCSTLKLTVSHPFSKLPYVCCVYVCTTKWQESIFPLFLKSFYQSRGYFNNFPPKWSTTGTRSITPLFTLVTEKV